MLLNVSAREIRVQRKFQDRPLSVAGDALHFKRELAAV